MHSLHLNFNLYYLSYYSSIILVSSYLNELNVYIYIYICSLKLKINI